MTNNIGGHLSSNSQESNWKIESTDISASSNTDNIYQNGNVGIGDFSGADVAAPLEVKTSIGNGIMISTTSTSQAAPSLILNNLDNNENTIITARDGDAFNVEYGVNNRLMSLNQDGSVTFEYYGDGTFTGTPRTIPMFTATGDIIEHPRKVTNPGDPIITVGGTGMTINSTNVIDRWWGIDHFTYRMRSYVSIQSGMGWCYLIIPTISGFRQPDIYAIGTYRNQTLAVQSDSPNGEGGPGASPYGPYMGAEAHHWSSTNRIYCGYYRREVDFTMYIEYSIRYWLQT